MDTPLPIPLPLARSIAETLWDLLSTDEALIVLGGTQAVEDATDDLAALYRLITAEMRSRQNQTDYPAAG